MDLRRKIILSISVLLMFFVIDNFWRSLGSIDGYNELNQWLRYSIRYFLQIALCLVFTYIILKFCKDHISTYSSLGLDKNIISGLLLSFIFTLPMLIGYSLIAPINSEVTFLDILFWSFIAGFSEELIFRGFLFGLLFRVLKIGFFPSIVLVSILFAIGHIYQGEGLSSILGVILITFIGSLLFGWLYIEWNNNLWVPIGTHILMNLYWSIFDIEASNAIGGWGANIFRFISIGFIILLTVRKINKEGSNIKGKLYVLDYGRFQI